MNKRTFIALAILFTGASVLLFNSFYQEATNTAITQLNEEQTILAKQAARGIEDFFASWTRSLNSLSKMDAIIDNDVIGNRSLEHFYEAHQEQIKSITRLNEKGVILYNFPTVRAAGTDISGQKHVQELLREHKPVISDVFRAVEGFDSVALHVPVFRGSVFKGSIGILIDFESLKKRYLDVIKIGETGYAWVVSRDGKLLYSPVPGTTGRSVFETIKGFPSLMTMVNDMLKGHEGRATYNYDRIGDSSVGKTRKYAVYMPVQIGNTFWSIAVTSAEQDVLSDLISFRNKLALVIGALFICGMAFSTVGAKAWFIVKEEEKRKVVELQLRQSEARLRDITFSLADWVWEVDEKGVYTYSSAKGNEIFGHVIGKTPFDLMPPDEAKRVAAIFSEIAANKAPIKDMENWNIGKEGERICLLTNGVPILDETGKLKGYRGVDKDITNRKSMEESLRNSEEKFREFFKNTPDYCYIISHEGTILNVNSAALRALGYEREELIDKPVSMIYDPGSFAKMKELFAQWKASGQIRSEEIVIVTKQGEKRTVLLNVGAVRDKDGTIIYSTSVQTDITDRKLGEAARREGLERYKAVVEAFDGFIYICSQDRRVEFMNKRLIGRTGRNAVGELCYKALHDSDAVCEWCVNEKVFKGETVRWEVQSPKDHRWYYVVNTPIYHVDGTMSKQSMIMDITERKLAEEALKESEAILKNSKKDLQRLAGRLISAQEEELRRLSRELHDDLTQRLAVLAIEAGKLELDLNKIPEKRPETVHAVVQIKDQLIKVSEDVHTISRQLHPTILDDLGLVRALESECSAVMGRHPVGIIFRKENVPDSISDDIALCLYRIVQEGLRNITAHSGAKNCEIYLKGDDHTLCLTVSDDGAGFDPLEVRSMPGLGLSSMRERVQLIEGTFAIRSQPGKGAMITVRVPLAGGIV